MKDVVFFNVCLASLLHDIGKFAYRCAPENEMMGAKGKRKSHEDFNEAMTKGLFNTEFKNYRGQTANTTIEGICVILGDWIAAQERDDLGEGEERNQPRTTPVKTVLSSVGGTEKYWKHRNLSLELPKIGDFCNKDNFSFLFEHYKEFNDKLADIDRKYNLNDEVDRRTFFRELLDLMKKYLSYIPSATYYSEPEIDLYNHSKLSCAISACLYQYYFDSNKSDEIKRQIIGLKDTLAVFFAKKNKCKTEAEKQSLLEEMKKDKTYSEKYFLLCKGNFSGIQDFVSTISSTKASALLKVRSFYLSFLNRLLPLYMVKQLELPEANIVFSSGGNFEILLPNTEKTKKEINRIANDINNHLLENSGIALFLEISLKEMSSLDFHRDVFPEFVSKWDWTEITSKNKKFSGSLKELFEPKISKDYCGICFKDADVLDNIEDVKVCGACKSLHDARRAIKEWQQKGEINELSNLFYINGVNLVSLLKYKNKYANINKIEGIYEIMPLGFPLSENGDIIDFDGLAESAKQRTGKRKIGALKFDVDNLGKIFGGHSKEHKISFSMYSRLSFDISLFFDGIINTLQSQEKYSRDIYIIYSGGDDGFIVGAWDKVLDFAKDLMNYFRIYVNQHKLITISAAYGLFSPKFPVKKIFEALEDDLEKAKSLDGKSAIVLLGVPVKWNFFDDFENYQISLTDKDQIANIFGSMPEILKSYSENRKRSFEIVFKLAFLFSSLAKTDSIARSFLMRFVSLSLDMANGIKRADNGALDIAPAWRMEYYLKREGTKNNDLFENLTKLWNDLCRAQLKEYPRTELLKENNIMELAAISAKIAQLNSGKNKGDKHE